jgi:hypothetical protein
MRLAQFRPSRRAQLCTKINKVHDYISSILTSVLGTCLCANDNLRFRCLVGGNGVDSSLRQIDTAPQAGLTQA